MFFEEFSLSTLGTKLHSLCLLRGLAHASGRMNTLIWKFRSFSKQLPI